MKVKKRLNKKINKNRQVEKFTKKEWFYLILASVLFWFYSKTVDKILNYNFFLFFICFCSVFTISVLIGIKEKTLSFWFEKIVKSLVFSFTISGIILLPLNFYIIDFSKGNPIINKNFDIASVSTSSARKQVRFEFMREIKVLYSYDEILYEVKKHPEKYKLNIRVRKSIFNTYVLDDWNIEKK